MEKGKDYFTKIDAWKAKKDDEAYQAAVKEENEYWEAQEKAKQLWPRVSEACKVFEKCLENGIKFNADFYASPTTKVGFFIKCDAKYDAIICFGWCILNGCFYNHLILTENGFMECQSCELLKKDDKAKITAYTINSHINDIEPFLAKFYKELDKILEN